MVKKIAGYDTTDPLSRWLRDRKFLVYSDKNPSSIKVIKPTDAPLTHVFLNGGRASVPESARTEFMQKYAESFLLGHSLYVVERPVRDRFKMFVDIDVKIPEHIDHDAIIDILEITKKVVECMPLSRSCDAVICTKKRPHEIIANGHGRRSMASSDLHSRKKGTHIIWMGDGSHVDKKKALEIKNRCVQECERKYGPIAMSLPSCSSSSDNGTTSVTWSDCVDSAVYKSSSLRMPLSRKKECPSVYFPEYMWCHLRSRMIGIDISELPSSYNIDDPVSDTSLYHDRDGRPCFDLVKTLDMCSIFVAVPPPSTEMVVDEMTKKREEETENDPDSVLNKVSASNEKRKKNKRNAENGLGSPMLQEGTLSFFPKCLESADGIVALEKDIRDALPPPYDKAPFKKLGASASESMPGLFISLDCRYCMNYGREHKNNHVYLVVNEKGIHQRCFCSCDTTVSRKFGRCGDAAVLLNSYVPARLSDDIRIFKQNNREDAFREREEKRRKKQKAATTAFQALPSGSNPQSHTRSHPVHGASPTEVWLQKVIDARTTKSQIPITKKK